MQQENEPIGICDKKPTNSACAYAQCDMDLYWSCYNHRSLSKENILFRFLLSHTMLHRIKSDNRLDFEKTRYFNISVFNFPWRWSSGWPMDLLWKSTVTLYPGFSQDLWVWVLALPFILYYFILFFSEILFWRRGLVFIQSAGKLSKSHKHVRTSLILQICRYLVAILDSRL